MRWVGTIANYNVTDKTAGEITGEFKLIISELGENAKPVADCSLALLALTAEIDNSIRLGGELDCARTLSSGSYKLVLMHRDEKLSEIEFSIGK